MILTIPGLLKASALEHARQLLAGAEWVDGRATAGHQSALAKDNRQLAEGSPAAREIGNLVLEALDQSALFHTAALPSRVFPPLVNLYVEGQSFGTHVDNAIRRIQGTAHRLRTDLSATLFLSAPEEYGGGELVIEDTFGVHQVKLPAGDLVLYPAASLHHVRPITRGQRVASFFWVQSLVRDDGRRTILFDLDMAIQKLAEERPDHASVLQLTNVYHNLLRHWAEL